MLKRVICGALAAFLSAMLTVSALAWGTGFTDYGGYSETAVEYSFLVEDSVMVYNKQVDPDFTYLDQVWAGSDLYIPIGAWDTSKDDSSEAIATEKQIKNDNVHVSYKALQGYDYVDNVSIVSGKKEKLPGIPSGMLAKVEFTDTFLPLEKSRVSVRLTLSVNGVGFQDTAITYNADIQNRVEQISRNSIYSALIPAQFKVSSNYFGEASFDFGGNIRYTSRVSGSQKYYLNLDRSPNPSLAEMYPDTYLEYYHFKGDNATFSTVGKLEIPINKAKFKEKKTTAQVYVYRVEGDRLQALTKDTVTYNAKTGKITLQTKSLDNYVLSSRALLRDVNSSSEEDILRSGYADVGGEVDEPSPKRK